MSVLASETQNKVGSCFIYHSGCMVVREGPQRDNRDICVFAYLQDCFVYAGTGLGIGHYLGNHVVYNNIDIPFITRTYVFVGKQLL